MRMGKPRIDWVNSCYTLFDNFLSFVSSSVDVDIVVALIVVSSVLLFCRCCRLFLFASAHSFVILHIFIFIHITYVRIVSCVLFLLFSSLFFILALLVFRLRHSARLYQFCVFFCSILFLSLYYFYTFLYPAPRQTECYKPSTIYKTIFCCWCVLFFFYSFSSVSLVSFIYLREKYKYFFLFISLLVDTNRMQNMDSKIQRRRKKISPIDAIPILIPNDRRQQLTILSGYISIVALHITWYSFIAQPPANLTTSQPQVQSQQFFSIRNR